MLNDQKISGMTDNDVTDETRLESDNVQIGSTNDTDEQPALTSTSTGGSGILSRLKRNGETTIEVRGSKPHKLTPQRAAEIALMNIRQYLREELRQHLTDAGLPQLADGEEIALLRPLAQQYGDQLARTLLNQRDRMSNDGVLNIALDTEALDQALNELLGRKGLLEDDKQPA